MKQRKSWRKGYVCPLMAGIALALGMVLALILIPYGNTHKTMDYPVAFEGTYQTPDMEEPAHLEAGSLPSAFYDQKVVLRGNFDHSLEAGDQIFFLIEYLAVDIRLDGEVVFSYGQEGDYPWVMHSAGMTWAFFRMPEGADRDSKFTITLENQYRSNYYSAYNDFVESFSTGDSGALARRVLADYWGLVLASMAFFTISIMFLLLGGFLALQNIYIHPSTHYFAGFSVAVSLWCALYPLYSTLVMDNPMLVTQLATCSMLAATILLPAYLGSLLESKAKRVNDWLVRGCLVMAIGLLTAQLLGLMDTYQMRTILSVVMGAGTLACVGIVTYEVRHNSRHAFRVLIIPGVAFAVCAVLEALNFGMELFRPDNKALFIGFFLLMSGQLILAVQALKRGLLLSRQAAEMEKELAESRVAVMLSQIQPHFLYNALTCIGELCAIDPPRAEEAVIRFSIFLRGNVDSLSATGIIPFARELTHIRHYLELEQMRFEERLRVVYEIGPDQFRLPPLTVQCMVENAVRYGVTAREEGGTVTISTHETRENWVITVADDGVGFDPDAVYQEAEGRSHVGIQNVRQRLEAQCGGKLLIRSTIGQGTTAVIVLPKLWREGPAEEI